MFYRSSNINELFSTKDHSEHIEPEKKKVCEFVSHQQESEREAAFLLKELLQRSEVCIILKLRTKQKFSNTLVSRL